MNADIKLIAAWLHGLAEEGGKGTVDNIDARALGRIAVALEAQARTTADLVEALKPFAKAADNYADCSDERYLDNDATLTVADLREARLALVEEQKP
jgi:hypothetical protein